MITTRQLLFNDPEAGEVFAVPPGERVNVVAQFESEVQHLPIEERFAAKKNIASGYWLVRLRGVIRGVRPEHLRRAD